MFGIRNTLRVILYFSLCLFLSSCASTEIKNINAHDSLEKYEDEARLWKRAEEFEEILQASGFLYPDEQLIRYVNDVLEKVMGSAVLPTDNYRLKAYVINDPLFNAFCLPNGSIYIHTSIIANLENEAQLATILGHEATHFLHRHALKEFRSLINKSALMSSLQVTFGAASGVVGVSADLAGLLTQFCVVGSFYGYSRDIEREADKRAFELMTQAGYDPHEAKRVMENMYEAIKDEKVKVPYLYHTHPKTKERIKNYEAFIEEYLKTNPAKNEGLRNTEKYNAMTKNLLLDNTELTMKRDSVKVARRQIERYCKIYPEDFKCLYLSGKLYMQEGNQEKAESEFQKSLALNPEFPESYKEIGLLYYKKKEKEKSDAAFKKYLQLKPEAKDAEYIRGYLHE
ncbi:MAG: hypothetical protein A2Y00_04565 [Omnitrophica WOR_2 bacterium GWF2_43_52]|nr:MAG: hypothetical protein A2Y01_04115 [Omnitrophica WOR_2 bacterium GWC2_44_8]OGX22313.1 MAG: hypothetical protein A2Y00_04565 [Omnitrophica WOR_2 bacterium GWF2_43_52]OGX58541.1 MAG: hypothetical protein A2460_02295 [Omnitrophica WOR_2 bacterium RIFOXYC2_FULL_43_9]